jgi:hypothetical protein
MEAAGHDLTAAAFPLNERIPLDDRSEMSVRILHPDQAPAPTLH